MSEHNRLDAVPQEAIDAYYHSSEWKRKRALQLEFDRNRCATCGATANLTVHHKPGSMALIPNEQIGRDLLTLCHDCHAAIHDVIRGRRSKRKHFRPDNPTNKATARSNRYDRKKR